MGFTLFFYRSLNIPGTAAEAWGASAAWEWHCQWRDCFAQGQWQTV